MSEIEKHTKGKWVIMNWNELSQQWIMLDAKSLAFMQEYRDCVNVKMLFRNIDKSVENYYFQPILERKALVDYAKNNKTD